MPDTPLNPDALDRVRDAVAEALGDAYHCTRDWSAWSYGTMSQDDFSLAWEDSDFVDEMARAVLAAALPEVTGEQVNLAGWTCNGIHEPGDYSTCEDCRDACDDLANFYNNMMQQPKADGPWTGRPEVKP